MKKLCIFVVMLFVAMNGSAVGITVYSDDFSGNSEAELHGVAPDMSPGSETWTAHSVWKADGSFMQSGTLNYAASVPLTVVRGKIYTLSLDVNLTASASGTRNVTLAFGNPAFATNISLSANTRNVAAIALTYAGTVNTYADGAASGLSSYVGGGSYTRATLKIVLKTFADSTPWTAEYFHDGISMGSVVVANGNAIDRIAFSSGQVDGFVDNLSLIETVSGGRSLQLVIIH